MTSVSLNAHQAPGVTNDDDHVFTFFLLQLMYSTRNLKARGQVTTQGQQQNKKPFTGVHRKTAATGCCCNGSVALN